MFKVQAENVNLYLSKPNYLEELLTQNGAVGDALRGAPFACISGRIDGPLTPPVPRVRGPGRCVQRETLTGIKDSLVTSKPLTFEHCIIWARLQFEEYFSNSIRQLLYNFPPDAVTESGVPFWSGTKRCPTPVVFDLSNVRRLYPGISHLADLRASSTYTHLSCVLWTRHTGTAPELCHRHRQPSRAQLWAHR